MRALDIAQPAGIAPVDVSRIKRTMQLFVRDELANLGLDFSVWDWTPDDHYGIYLGMFVKIGVVRDSKTLQHLLEFACEINRNYLPNFYHSFYHAIDMTYMTYYLINDMGIREQLELSTAEVAALLLAALGHDVLHPGTNNLYQISSKTHVAKLYHNQSVLENQSLNFVRSLLISPRFIGLMNGFHFDDIDAPKSETVGKILEIIADSIIKTDMTYHFSLLEQIATFSEENEQIMSRHSSILLSPFSATEVDGHRTSGIRNHSDISNSDQASSAREITDISLSESMNSENEDSFPSKTAIPSGSVPINDHKDQPAIAVASNKGQSNALRQHSVHASQQIFKLRVAESSELDRLNSVASMMSEASLDMLPKIFIRDAKARQAMLNVVLHAADISNPARPQKVCKRWSDLVTQEFFNQGDLEHKNNLPVSPNMDRETTNQIQIQIAFMDFIVRPFFESLAEVFPRMVSFADIIHENARQWNSMLPPSPVSSKTEGEADSGTNVTLSPTPATVSNATSPGSTSPQLPSSSSMHFPNNSPSMASFNSKRKISLEQEIARKSMPMHAGHHSFGHSFQQSYHGYNSSGSGSSSGSNSLSHSNSSSNFASSRRLSMAAGTVEIPESVEKLFNRLRSRNSNAGFGTNSAYGSQTFSQSNPSNGAFRQSLKAAVGVRHPSQSGVQISSIAQLGVELTQSVIVGSGSYLNINAAGEGGSDVSSQALDERDELGVEMDVDGLSTRFSRNGPYNTVLTPFPGASPTDGKEGTLRSIRQRRGLSMDESDICGNASHGESTDASSTQPSSASQILLMGSQPESGTSPTEPRSVSKSINAIQ